MADTEAQKRAKKKWDQSHREAKQRINSKSTAKRFVRDMATPEEWEELVKIYNEAHSNQRCVLFLLPLKQFKCNGDLYNQQLLSDMVQYIYDQSLTLCVLCHCACLINDCLRLKDLTRKQIIALNAMCS